jgi:general secretion pathway protein D
VPTVALSTTAGTVSRGDVVTSSVEVSRLGETSYAAFDVVYDPTVLEFQGATDGTFLSNRGLDGTLFQAGLQDNTPGRVTVGVSRVARVRGVAGNGTLLRLSFKALRAGTTTLAFGDPRTIRNSDHREVSIEAWEDRVITVR